jgi:16S rRNA (guanine1516-N2)-methyltransferase
MRHRRRAGHNELLGRAVGLRRRRDLAVVDCTAGFGRDAFVLADLGARVILCERQPLLAVLLRHALLAGLAGDEWLRDVCGRMRLVAGDVRGLAADEIAGADALYLDPMFPAAGRRAASGKEMAVLQHLLDDDEAAAERLLDWALEQPVPRVVVKRPRRAPPLRPRARGHCLEGRAVRFDVYLPRRQGGGARHDRT